MNKDMDAQFLCKDCARYHLCEYYHRRKNDSYICKYFHLSETPKMNWIPVSERLPEIHQDVILSLRSLEIVVGFRAETEPYFYCRGCYIESQNVLAWMPLPDPYKEESEG